LAVAILVMWLWYSLAMAVNGRMGALDRYDAKLAQKRKGN
jgi:hypothetical protein